jgi:hypothetical protein
MRRFVVGCAIVVLVGSVACSSSEKKVALGMCKTDIHLNVDNNGDLEIANPDKLTCAAEQPIDITFYNHDLKEPHVFQISEIGCKGVSPKKNNPTGGMLGKPTVVFPGMSKPFDGTPKMLKQDEIKAAACAGNTYVYSYTIKVPGVKDRDPDLEVSPPPPFTFTSK